MKRAFTLIELLVIIAIMGTMVTVGTVSIRAGQNAARLKGAVRDIYALMRRARSTALVTQQPALITYDNKTVDDETMASVEITSAKIIDTENAATDVITLTGAPLKGHENDEPVKVDKLASTTAATNSAASGGETLEDVLFAPISEDVVKGVKIKVLMGEAELVASGGTVQKSSISVFSTTDYLVRKLSQKKASETETKAKEESSSTDKSKTSADDMTAPVTIQWETNGRVDSHKVWVYPSDKHPEDGMLLKVDRFGGIKVLNGDGTGEDD